MDQQPADVLLVLDRSGSMNWAIDSNQDCGAAGLFTSCQKRWTSVTSAVDTVLSSNIGGLRWGLKLFGSLSSGKQTDNWGCVVNPGVEVGITSGTATVIRAKIAISSTGSATPTRAAVQEAVSYLASLTDPYPRYILLATDGQPNCPQGCTAANSSTSDLVATTKAIMDAATAGFKTYVVGISPDAGNLTGMAQAGGTSNYYSAKSPSDLVNALKAIAGQVASCTFTFATPPPDPQNVAVYLDKSMVTQDPADGWTFGASNTEVDFHGKSCDAIKSGTYSSVEIRFGCSGEAPPSVIP
jgi:hypothetical protein